jgi:DNA-binding LacI/PurR family transcriptional regulator
MTFVPKYQRILKRLQIEVEKGALGERLPSVRALMANYEASQSTIERCLDDLVRNGLVRRKRGSGIFIDGTQPRSHVIGVYTDSEVSPHSNSLFLDGVRSVAEKHGFRAADFGPHNIFENPEETINSTDIIGFAGVIAATSTTSFFLMEDDQLLASFRQLRLPLVTCLPIPSIAADTVMPDHIGAFRRLGEQLRRTVKGPVKFLGHLGIPSLARLHGLRIGLGKEIQLEPELLDRHHEGAYERVAQLIREKWRGNLVIGVQPDHAGLIESLRGGPWQKGSPHVLAITLEQGDLLPPGIVAYVELRPSFRLGAAAAELVLRRIRGYRGELRRVIVPHELIPTQLNERRASGRHTGRSGGLPASSS